MKKGSKWAAALLAALLLFSVCGCRSKDAAPLRVGVMYSSDIIPLAVMKDRGLDEAEGVSLDMQVFSSAKDRDAALQAGELDGVFTDYVGLCIYQGAGLDVRATGCTDGDYLLLAAPGSGIASLTEAAGGSVAVSENTLIEYALDFILRQGGLAPEDVKKEIVPRIPDRLELMRAGQVGLSLLPEPFATLAKADGAAVLSSANAVGLYPAVSAFTAQAIETKGGAIRRFYTAYDKAVAYVNETPLAQFEDVVIEGAGFPEELRGQIELPRFRPNELPKEADLQRAIDWSAAKGLCPAGLTPADLLGALE